MSDTQIELPETMHIETEQETAPPVDTTDRPPSPREEAMARIAERRREAIEREVTAGVEFEDQARETAGVAPLDRAPEVDGLAGAAADTPQPRASEPQAAAGSGGLVAPAAATPDERRHPITIDGAQYLVTDAELAHLASIGAQTVRQQQQPQRQTEPQPQSVVRQESTPPAASDRERLSGIVRRMSYGNDEDGVAAVQELLTLAQPQQIDQRAIVEQAKAEIRGEATLNQNLLTIGREFPEVFGAPDRALSDEERRTTQARARLAAIELYDIRQRDQALGVYTPDLQAYREAATRVKSALGLSLAVPQSGQQVGNQPVSQAARTTVAPMPDRLERKRAAPRQPSGVGRVASSGEAQRAEPSKSDIVAWIAKSRHQQSPTRVQ